jgi:NAD(P)-dependent dehydrogenase (short-subunit alcohol dehydrogenase family)
LPGFNLEGKVAVITGAASGIGRAIAQTFAAHQAKVWVMDVDHAAANSVVDEIRQAGGEAWFQVCNVGNPTAVNQAFAAIAAEGSIDILVNSAGIAHIGTVASTTTKDFERVFRVNVQGVYLCMQAAVTLMLAHAGGVILNLASTVAVTGIPDRFAYSMSKGAVRAMTFSVARDYLDKNIRCNCITPGRVHTPFVDGFVARNYPGREQEMMEVLAKAQPIGRMAKPEEVAHLALYLCSDLSTFLTGADVPFDGGTLNLRV